MTLPPLTLDEGDWPTLIGRMREERAQGLAPLTARRRVERFFDAGSFVEMGALARRGSGVQDDNEDDEQAGAHRATPVAVPADALVAGWGLVEGRRAFIVSDDASLGGGVRGPAAAGKAARARDLALRQGRPSVQLLESRRAAPDLFVGAEFSQAGFGVDFGHEFAAAGTVPRVVAAFTPLDREAAFEAAAADFVVLAGDHELMIDSTADALAAGAADYRAVDEDGAFSLLRTLLGYLPPSRWEAPPTTRSDDSPTRGNAPLCSIVPREAGAPYDVRAVVSEIVDSGQHLELRPSWAPRAVTYPHAP